MRSLTRFYLCVLTFALGLLLATAPAAMAQEHVVSPADLQKDRVDATQTRQSNQAKVEKFLDSKIAKDALKKAGIEPKKVSQAVAQLDDEDLARLAERTDKIQRDFAAGALTNEQITYIIIALVTAVVILVVVVA